jgi:RsiW-degrading membrane proteinase PrsW (M82 family)
MSQYYGVLRVVRVRPTANATKTLQDKYPSGWLPEERLVHLLAHKQTTIGRALSNDLVLMDSTISREHARLVYDEQGWRIFNLTEHNVVSVNGHLVPAGGSWLVHTQDFLVIGSTMLQLIAPQLKTTTAQQSAQDGQELSGLDASAIVALPVLDGSATNGHQSHNGTHTGSLKELLDASDELLDAGAVWPCEPAPATDEHATPLLSFTAEESEEWSDTSDHLVGMGVTMQFALARRFGGRRFWAVLGIGVAIVLILVMVILGLNSLLSLAQITRNGFSNIVLALTIPLLPALGINLLVNFIDRFEREPWFLRMAAFLWGAIIAIPTALVIEHNIDLSTLNIAGSDDVLRSLLGGLNAGVTEETVKGLGLLLLFFVLRDEFDNITDGIVYGALIGAGFAMVENFVKFTQYANEFLPYLIVGRVVLGWLCHSTFTACFGATLGYVRHTRVRWRQIVFPLLGYLSAVGLHTVFDFINLFANALVLAYPENITAGRVSLIAIIGSYVPPFIAQIILLYFLIKALIHEGAVIREFLVSEVSDGVVMMDEYAVLQNSFLRTKLERQVLWRYGFKQWLRVKALYQTEIGLAFRKWHGSMGDQPKLGYLHGEEAYRNRIKRLRQEMALHEQRHKRKL